MRKLVCLLTAFMALAACGGEAVNAPPPTELLFPADPLPEPLPGTSGLVTTPGVKPACIAKLSNLPPLIPRPVGEPPNPNKPMTKPRLIAGSETPILPREVLVRHLELYIIARCILHKEGHVTDCNFVCSYPIADEAVLENIYARRYSPVMLDGVPVDVTYTFQFHIERVP